MDLLWNLVFLLVVAGIVWWFIRPHYSFIVRISDGQPACYRGKVTDAFLRDVAEVCQSAGVKRGSIYGTLLTSQRRSRQGVKRNSRIRLTFSSGFPLGCQQQLRNLSMVQQ